MSTVIKIIIVNGAVWKISSLESSKVVLKSGMTLGFKEKLLLTDDSSIIIKLPNGQIIEIKGHDLITQNGIFSLSMLAEITATPPSLKIEKSTSDYYHKIRTLENNDEIIWLEDGRIFKQQNTHFIEIEPTTETMSNGFRFVQLASGRGTESDGITLSRIHRLHKSIEFIESKSHGSEHHPQNENLQYDQWSNLYSNTILLPLNNDAPIANAVAANGNEDATSISITLTASDIDSAIAGYVIENLPANGTLYSDAALTTVVTANSTITVNTLYFVPHQNWNGTSTFDYHATDGSLDSNTASATITVNAVNDAPIANVVAANGNEDATSISITLTASDIDSAIAGYVIESLPANGTLYSDAALTAAIVVGSTVTNATLYFVPHANWNGTSTFNYHATDGSLDSNTASATITVNAVNDAPIANVVAANGNEDATSISITLTASDIDSAIAGYVIESLPANGTLYSDAALTAAIVVGSTVTNATLYFVPHANWNGTSTFDYHATDGSLNSNTASATITVNAVNDAPIANAVAANGNEDDASISITLTASDIDSAIAGYVIESLPANGTLYSDAALTAAIVVGSTVTNATLYFVPHANWNGTSTFDYHATDGSLDSNSASATITVNAVNDAPIANAVAANGNEDATSISITLTASDIDSAIAGYVIESLPANGTLYSDAALTAAIVVGSTVTNATLYFVPNANWNGTSTFDYHATDGSLNSNTASATITVNAVNDAPVTADDTANVNQDTVLTLTSAQLLTNDSDVDGDTLSITSVQGAVNGSVALVGGNVEFTPTAGYSGAASFTYTVSDGKGGTSTATVNVTVDWVNHAPLFNTDIDEQRVNSYTANDQNQPAITTLADGGYVVTWSSWQQDGSSYGVYAQRYAADGTKQGGEFLVNSYTNSDQIGSAITALTGGGFVVTWTSYNQDGSNYGVFAQRYATDGTPQDSEFQVNSYTNGEQSIPAITALADGGYVVTWQSYGQDGSDFGVFAQRYTADGSKLGGEFQVNSYIISNQSQSAITALADGGFVVTWQSYAQDGSYYGVYAQRYAADGSKLGGEFQVNSYTNSDQYLPAITALNDGGFVVTWQSYAQDGSWWGIFAQRFAADGSTLGNEFQVNSYISNNQFEPAITALAGGGFVVTWQSLAQDGSGYGIYAQRFAADGSKLGDEFQVNSYTTNEQYQPAITALADGGFVVTWQSYAQDGSVWGVFAQRYAADGTPFTALGSVTEDAVNNTAVGQLLATDVDIVTAGDSLTYTIQGSNHGVYGSISIDNTGRWTYTLDNSKSATQALKQGQSEIETFTARVTDSQGLYAEKIITVTVKGANDAPTAVDDIANVNQNTVLTLTPTQLLANDSDVDGDTLTITSVQGAVNGSVALVGGNIQFTPTTGYSGAASFTYTVSDGKGGTSTATVNITVDWVNHAPVFNVDMGEQQVNSTTSNNQFDPTITTLADGSYIVTWSSNQLSSNGYDIYAQRYAADGSKQGGEFLVNSTTSNNQFEPAITALADGDFVVTWSSQNQDGSGYGVYAQRYAADGSKLGGEFQVNSYTNSDQSYPAITALAGGGFVVTWTSLGQDGSGYGMYAQRYAADGSKLGGEFLVNSYTNSDQYLPAITALNDGSFVVTWASNAQDGSGYGIYAQRYAADGSKLGGEFQVNSYTNSDQYLPAITALNDGGFVVTWQSYAQDGSWWGIFAQRFAADGSTLGNEFQVNSYTLNNQFEPAITALAGGGFVVTWQSLAQDGSGYGIYAQRFAADGSKLGDEFQVNSYTTNEQYQPAITALADGGFVVTWQSYAQDGSNHGVYSQRYAADGTPVTALGSVSEDTPSKTIAVGQLLATDVDIVTAGDTLTYTIQGSNSGVYGSISLDSTGRWTYTLDNSKPATQALKLNESKTETFTARVTDSQGLYAEKTITVTVIGTNDAPSISTQSITTDEDTPYTGQIVATDVEGDTLSYGAASAAAHGSLSINTGTGAYTYTPHADYHGTDSFVIRVSDGKGGTADSTVTVNVLPVNDAPIANAVTVTGDEDATAISITLNATDIDSSIAGYIIETLPVNGVLYSDAALTSAILAGSTVTNNTVYFVPTANWNGVTIFNYHATDGSLNSNTATVTILVNAVNDAPVAVVDSYTVLEGGTLTVSLANSVLNNDSDAENDSLTAVLVTAPTNGSLILNANGTFTYVHNGSETTTDSFTYRANDGTLNSNIVTVTLNITPVNDAPIAVADSITVAEGGTATTLVGGATSLLTNDTDAENNPLTAVLVTGPAYGTLTLSANGTFTYVHNGSETTTDSFTYRANDGTTNSNIATVTINITPVNDAPVANADTANVNQDAVLTLTPAQLLANDTDVEGDTLSITSVQGAVNGTVNIVSGNIVFIPNAGYSGTASFTYTVSDGKGGFSTATAYVTVNAVNHAPIAIADTVIPTGNLGLYGEYFGHATLLNSTEQARAYITGQIASATFVATTLDYAVLGTGLATGTNLQTFLGADATSLNTDPATTASAILRMRGFVELGAGTYNFRIISDDGYQVLVDGKLVAEVAGAQSATATVHNTFTIANSGLHHIEILYWDKATDAVFKAELSDNGGSSYQALSSFNLYQTSNANLTVTEDMPLTIAAATLLANDSDIDGDTLSITSVQGAVNGTVNLVGGNVEFIPTANYAGPASFSYNISDGKGGTATATVQLTVTPVNDAPVATDDSITIAQNVSRSIPIATLLANDSDTEGDSLTISSVFNAVNGTVSISGTNVVFTPTTGFEGNARFSYTVRDALGAISNPATVNVTVGSASAPSVVVSRSLLAIANGTGGTSVKFPIATALVDSDGSESLSVKISSVPASLSFNAGVNLGAGVWQFSPADLPNLMLNLPGSYTTNATHLTIQVTSTEMYGGATASTSTVVTLKAAYTTLNVATTPSGSYTGGSASEWIQGGAGDNTINAANGNNVIHGDAGNDTLSAGSGSDMIYGGSGNDIIDTGSGTDRIYGGAGNDTLKGGDAGENFVDVFVWELGDQGAAGTPAVDTIQNFATTAAGSNGTGGDVLDLRDLLQGEMIGAANSAGNLANYLHFEISGSNTLIHISHTGGFSTDSHYIGGSYSSGAVTQQIVLDGVNLQTVYSGATTDQQIITQLLNNNKLIVDGGLTYVAPPLGFAGRMLLASPAIEGTDTDDDLIGTAGDDRLIGGMGNDILTGGLGTDVFVWQAGDVGHDSITDFNHSEGDQIDVSALLDNLGWDKSLATLNQFASATGNTIELHATDGSQHTSITVLNHQFDDLNDMMNKINFKVD